MRTLDIWRCVRVLAAGCFCYCASSAIVYLGVVFGSLYFEPSRHLHADRAYSGSLTRNVARWDALAYVDIADHGYSASTLQLHVAYFPVFPFLGSVLRGATGISATYALLAIANLAGLGFCVLWLHENGLRAIGDSSWLGVRRDCDLAANALVAMLLNVGSLFMRMPYSESLFMLLSLIAFSLMQRQWSPLVVALVVGLGTGTRLFGLCLLAPLILYAYDRCQGARTFAIYGPLAVLLGSWGIMAWMTVQWLVLGDPLSFVSAQSTWELRSPNYLSADTALLLVRAEPLWFLVGCDSREFHRGTVPGGSVMLLDWDVMNALSLVTTCLLVALGAWRRWLTRYEIAYCVATLLFVYCLQGPRAGVASAARYLSVLFPVFMVISQLLSRCDQWMASLLVAIAGALLALFSACYAAGYQVY